MTTFTPSVVQTILVLGISLSLISCGDRTEETLPEIVASDGPELESWDIDLNVLENSIPRFHIRAGYQAQYEQGDSTFSILRPGEGEDSGPVEISLYDEAGSQSGLLSANEVVYQSDKGSLIAKSQVVLEGKDGKILTSEYLFWEQKSRRVSTSGYVTIVSASEELQGYDLVANEDLSLVEIKNLTGVVRLSN